MHVTIILLCWQEAVDWLYDHPKVLAGGIGLSGLSKGAELALYISTITPKVQ